MPDGLVAPLILVDVRLVVTERCRVGPSALSGVGAATPTGLAGVDVDRLIEAIEERVLAEIERRGGRYTGLF